MQGAFRFRGFSMQLLGSKRLSLLAGVLLGMNLGVSAARAGEQADSLQGFTGSNQRGFTGSNERGFTGSNQRGFTGSNERGFTGSNERGFTGSNQRGFTGSNERGFTGSNQRGFTGSNERGFTGSNERGFTGSNERGFTGSNEQGFTGSNQQGFTGSNERGFTGSNQRGFTGSNERGTHRAATSGFGGSFLFAAMGPVDSVSVDSESTSLTVAGQVFSVSQAEASVFRLGDYVVAGATAPGAPAIVYSAGMPYVPGVSTVRVKAPIASVDAGRGTVTAGKLVINYTPHLSNDPTLAPSTGETVQAVGIQPAPGGALIVSPSGDGISLIQASAAVADLANRQ